MINFISFDVFCKKVLLTQEDAYQLLSTLYSSHPYQSNFKEKEADLLIKALISVLETAFQNITISSIHNYYYITGVSNTAMFSIVKSLLEELYLRFLDDDEPDSEFLLA